MLPRLALPLESCPKWESQGPSGVGQKQQGPSEEGMQFSPQANHVDTGMGGSSDSDGGRGTRKAERSNGEVVRGQGKK